MPRYGIWTRQVQKGKAREVFGAFLLMRNAMREFPNLYAVPDAEARSCQERVYP